MNEALVLALARITLLTHSTYSIEFTFLALLAPSLDPSPKSCYTHTHTIAHAHQKLTVLSPAIYHIATAANKAQAS